MADKVEGKTTAPQTVGSGDGKLLTETADTANAAATPPVTETNTEPKTREITCFDELLKVHACYREKATHEDNLINQRKTWLLLSQTFLFGALVVLRITDGIEDVEVLKAVIILVGITSAVSAIIGILAAHIALSGTSKRWNALKVKDEWRNTLPAIEGSGEKWFAKFLGGVASFITPVVLVVAWGLTALAFDVTPCDLWPSGEVPTEQAETAVTDPPPVEEVVETPTSQEGEE